MKAHLIANTKSGKGAGGSLPELARKVAESVGAELNHYDTTRPETFAAQIDRAVAAAKADGGVVIAAGGDGTIRSVAQKAAEGQVKFGVVACGTFNFFARNHGIPEEPEEALRLALTGEVRKVRLGEVNGTYFLINASLGLYAKAIRDREGRTKRWGRNRLVVIISTLVSLLSRHRTLHVDLVMPGQVMKIRTPTIFLGNNALQLRDLAMDVAKCMKADLLAAVVMKPLTRWETFRVLWRGLSKTLEQEERLETFCVDSLTIHSPQAVQTVALDGELFQMRTPLKIRAVPEILNMVLPPRKPA